MNAEKAKQLTNPKKLQKILRSDKEDIALAALENPICSDEERRIAVEESPLRSVRESAAIALSDSDFVAKAYQKKLDKWRGFSQYDFEQIGVEPGTSGGNVLIAYRYASLYKIQIEAWAVLSRLGLSFLEELKNLRRDLYDPNSKAYKQLIVSQTFGGGFSEKLDISLDTEIAKLES